MGLLLSRIIIEEVVVLRVQVCLNPHPYNKVAVNPLITTVTPFPMHALSLEQDIVLFMRKVVSNRVELITANPCIYKQDFAVALMLHFVLVPSANQQEINTCGM